MPSSPLIPSSLAGRSWDEPARDSRRRRSAPSPFLDVHQAQVSLTSIPASAPLVPGRAAPIPHFSFSDTVQGRQSKSQAWAMIHLRTYEHRFWGRTSARYGGQRGWGEGSGAEAQPGTGDRGDRGVLGQWSTGESDRGGLFSIFPLFSPGTASSFSSLLD